MLFMLKPLHIFALLLVLLLNSYASLAYAKSYTTNSVPHPYKQLSVVYVVDPDNILTTEDKNTINQRLQLLEERTLVETVVVALPSIGQQDTRQFAHQLFNKWQVGKKEKDNGLLILLVIDQREVVFEVGYGLEGNLTDAMSYRLMEQYMLPFLKKDQFSTGMVKGSEGISRYLEQHFYDGTLYPIGVNHYSMNILTLLILGLIVLSAIYIFWGDRIITISNWYKAKYRSPLNRLGEVLLLLLGLFMPLSLWPVLNFSFSFTNIFLVLVASIILLLIGPPKALSLVRKKNTPKKLICNKCRHRSVIQIKESFTHLLSPNEQYEKSIRSVYFHAFQCERAKCRTFFIGKKTDSHWRLCSTCQLNTAKRSEIITIKKATKTENGQRNTIYQCIKCQLAHTEKSTILSEEKRSNQRNGFGGSSSGGGFSGGGFRGGGSSGGGGARGRF